MLTGMARGCQTAKCTAGPPCNWPRSAHRQHGEIAVRQRQRRMCAAAEGGSVLRHASSFGAVGSAISSSVKPPSRQHPNTSNPRGTIAYAAWRDGGLTLLDIADPTAPKLLAWRNTDPPFGGGTHSPLPLPDRNLLVLADEPTSANCKEGLRYIWLFRIREPSNPVSIATFPSPTRLTIAARAATSGRTICMKTVPAPSRVRAWIFATYYNAGVRAYDIADPFCPRELGFDVLPNPTRMMDPRPNRPQVIQSCDCYVDRSGLMYLTDPNAGLNILQFEGELAT